MQRERSNSLAAPSFIDNVPPKRSERAWKSRWGLSRGPVSVSTNLLEAKATFTLIEHYFGTCMFACMSATCASGQCDILALGGGFSIDTVTLTHITPSGEALC